MRTTLTNQKTPATNNGLSIWRLKCFYETFVQGSAVNLLSFCAKIRHIAKAKTVISNPLDKHRNEKKKIYLFSLSFILTNCVNISNDKVGTCCDKIYTNIDSAINCLSRTKDGNGTTTDERFLLIAFVEKDLEVNQKLGWDIIKDPDIVKTVKKNYALVILDANQYKILNDDCSYNIAEIIEKTHDRTIFVIINQALCVFGDWTLNDDKESIIERLQVGNGP